MPRVVIELQANTQAAVQQIQQFAKAQRDAFDVVRVGTPVLADAQIKISKLTETMRGSALVTGELNQTAKMLARGGLQDLVSGVPVLGQSMGALSRVIDGLSPIMLGAVAAGAGIVKMLIDVGVEAGNTVKRIEALSTAIVDNMRKTELQVAQMRAARMGGVGGAEAGAGIELEAARRERDQAIAAARAAEQAAQPGLGSKEHILGAILGDPAAVETKKQLLAAERRAAELKAEADFELKAFAIREQLAGKLETLEADRVKNYEESRDKEVKAAEAAAEKEAAAFKAATDVMLGLGGKFDVAQFIQKTEQQIAALQKVQEGAAQGAIDLGKLGLTTKDVSDKLTELQTASAQAAATGLIPLATRAKQVEEAFTGTTRSLVEMGGEIDSLAAQINQVGGQFVGLSAEARETADHSNELGHEINSLNMETAALDRILALVTPKQNAMANALEQTAGAAANATTQVQRAVEANRVYTASLAGVIGGTGPGGMITAQDILGGRLRAGGPPLSQLQNYQYGGTVPGHGPVPIMAHGGERILPRGTTDLGSITINITQAPNQDPQALVRALMPELRAATTRGTV